jgi:DMSO/TMAO reductase YedYZ molybdopterin-dependent catalytic subunit
LNRDPAAPAGLDPLRPASHEPNPTPPSADPTIVLVVPGRNDERLSLADLEALPYTRVADCFIASTGHSPSGPFTFGGVALADLLRATLGPRPDFTAIEIVSGDGFGTRVGAAELVNATRDGDLLLAYEVDGRRLTRPEGVVRLILPQEADDALRQIKWVGTIRVRP